MLMEPQDRIKYVVWSLWILLQQVYRDRREGRELSHPRTTNDFLCYYLVSLSTRSHGSRP